MLKKRNIHKSHLKRVGAHIVACVGAQVVRSAHAATATAVLLVLLPRLLQFPVCKARS